VFIGVIHTETEKKHKTTLECIYLRCVVGYCSVGYVFQVTAIMTVPCIGSILGSALLLLSIVCQDNAQVTNGEGCAGNFNVGNVNFVLDTEDSVKVGASFISSPTVTQAEDCVDYCCQDPNCNLALIENGAEKGSVKTCFLFNCLYKREYVCRFVNKVGFTNYILDSVYEDYLGGPESTRGKIKTRLTPVPGSHCFIVL
jgi:hypothetical protein